MKTYLFNIQTTIEVEAENEVQAYELLNDNQGDLRERDVLLVEVSK